MRWWPVTFPRLRHRQIDAARAALEGSEADRQAVHELSTELHRHSRSRRPDRFTARVEQTLRGRRP